MIIISKRNLDFWTLSKSKSIILDVNKMYQMASRGSSLNCHCEKVQHLINSFLTKKHHSIIVTLTMLLKLNSLSISFWIILDCSKGNVYLDTNVQTSLAQKQYGRGVKTQRVENLTCLREGNLAICFESLKNMHGLDPEIQLLRIYPKLITLILKQNNLSTNMLTNVYL